MAQLNQVMDMAVRHHQAGRLDQAQGLYAQVLAAQPRHPGALASLGALLLQRGQVDQALAMLQEAAGLQPEDPRLLNNLGLAYRAAGQDDQAQSCFRRALALEPDSYQAAANLADLLLARGEGEQAREILRRLCQERPRHAPAHHNLALALARGGDLAGAEAALRRCLELDPEFVPAWNNLGGVLQNRGQAREAVAAYEQALLRDPLNPRITHNLARALLDCGRYQPALERLQEVQGLLPRDASVQNSLGLALMGLGQVRQAVAAFLQALTLNQRYPRAQLNLAGALMRLGELEGAEEACATVLEGDPQNRPARLLRAELALLRGDYPRAWADWPRRGGLEGLPAWDGSPLEGRGLVLQAQGPLELSLSFLRLVPLAAARGGRLWLRPHPDLAGLELELPGLEGVLEPGEKPPASCRLSASLLDLGALLQVTPEQVPQEPFLRPEEELRRRWRRLLPEGGLRIGLAWRADSVALEAACLSPPAQALAPLAGLEGVHLIPLQAPPYPDDLEMTELEPPQQAASLLALMAELDLVICGPGLCAELAGAAGLESWVLLGPGPDWSWGLGETSPWHPGARLFRAPEIDDWSQPARELARALAARRGG